MYNSNKKQTRANSINFSAMSIKRSKNRPIDTTCDGGTTFVHQQAEQLKAAILDDKFGVPLFHYSSGEDDDIVSTLVASEFMPVDDSDHLLKQVLKRQQLKRSLQYVRKAQEKERYLRRLVHDELIDVVEEKEQRRHAQHIKVVRTARAEASLVREAQKRHIESRRARQHSRREPLVLQAQSLEMPNFVKSVSAFSDKLDKFTLPFGSKVRSMGALVADCTSFVYLVLKAKNKLEVIAASHLFARARGFGLYKEAAVAAIALIGMKIFERSAAEKSKDEQVLQAHALSDEIRKVGADVKLYLHCNSVEAIKKIISIVVGLERFQSKETAFEIYKWIPRTVTKYTTWPDLIEAGFDAIATVIRLAELLNEGMPLSEALFSDDPITSVVKRAEELILKKDFTYIGLPIDGFMERTTFNREVSVVLESLRQFGSKMSSVQRKSMKLDEILAKLTLMHLQNQTFGRGRSRLAPLGIVIHGASSIGKSILLKYVSKLHCDVVKRPYSPDLIYQKNDEEWWNGYSPASNPYIQFPEVGCLHENIAAKQGDTLSKMLLSLIDTNPFNCMMADLDSKGKIYATPELVLIDTNIPGMNFKVTFNNPAAFARRFLYIWVKVKPEFQKEGSESIDPAKVEALSGGRNLDVYEFTIYRKVPTDSTCKRSKAELVKGNLGIDEFSDVIRFLMFDHMEKQKKFTEDSTLTGYGTPLDFDSVTTKAPVEAPPKKPVPLHKRFVESVEQVGMRSMSYLHKCAYHVQDNIMPKFNLDLNGSDFDYMGVSHGVKRRTLADDVLRKQHAIDTKLKNIQTSISDRLNAEYNRLTEVTGKELSISVDSISSIIRRTGYPELADKFVLRFADVKNGCIVPGEDIEMNNLIDAAYERIEGRKLANIEAHRPPSYSPSFAGSWGGISSEDDLFDIDFEVKEDVVTVFETDDNRPYDKEQSSEDKVLSEQCRKCAWYTGNGQERYICSPGTRLGDNHWEEKEGILIPRDRPIDMEAAHKEIADRKAYYIEAHTRRPKTELKPVISCVPNLNRFDNDYSRSVQLFFVWLQCWLKSRYFNFFHSMSNVSYIIHFIFLFSLFALWFRWYGLVIGVVIFHLLYLNYAMIASEFGKKQIRSLFMTENIVEQADEEVARAANRIAAHHGRDQKWWIAVPVLVTLAGVISAVIYFYKADPLEMKPESSDFKLESDLNKKLNEMEEKFDTGVPEDRIIIKDVPDLWNKVYSSKRCKYTGDVKSLSKVVKGSIRHIKYVGAKTHYTRGFLISANIMVIAGHAIYYDEQGNCEIHISPTDDINNDKCFKKTRFTKDHIVQLKDDLYILYVNQENSRDLTKHFAPDGVFQGNTRGIFADGDVIARYESKPKLRIPTVNPRYNGIIPVSDVFYYDTDKAADGMCVTPLLLQKDVGACIGGFHICGDPSMGGACVVTESDVLKAIVALKKTCTLMEQSVAIEPEMLPEHLSMPHPKSFMRHEVLHGFEYWGSIPDFGSVNNKSQVKSTGLNKNGAVDQFLFDNFSYVGTTEYGPPLMKEKHKPEYINPWNINVKNIAAELAPLDRDKVEICVDSFVKHIKSHFKPDRRMKPWDIDVAINGAINDGYVKRVDAGKSAGFGHPGVKGDYLVLTDGFHREPVEQVKKELLAYIQRLEKGENPGAVYIGQLKDEPRSLDKIAIGKTRLFCVSEVVNLLAARMFLGPIFTLVMENNDAFRTSLGVDMHRGGVRVFEKIANFSDNIWEGDYSKFDQTIPFDISWGCCTVIYRLAQWLGYNGSALNAARGLLTDTMFPFLVVNGDVIRCPGFNPSGMFDTVVLNSIKNILMKMYFVVAHTGNPDDFWTKMFGSVLGDDTGDAVLDEIKDWCNGVEYQKFCHLHYNMKFTPTDKDGKMTPFVPKQDFTFLKRRDKYCPLLKREVGILDLDSCRKTLMWRIPSGIIDEFNQTLQAAESVLTELFMHSCTLQQFDNTRTDLINIISDAYCIEKSFLHKYFKNARGLVESLNVGLPALEDLDLYGEKVVVEQKEYILSAQSASISSVFCGTQSIRVKPKMLTLMLVWFNLWSCFSTSVLARRPLEDGRGDMIWSFGYGLDYSLTENPCTTKIIEWGGNARTLNEVVRQTRVGICHSTPVFRHTQNPQVASAEAQIILLKQDLARLIPVPNPLPGLRPSHLAIHPSYTSTPHFRESVDLYLDYISRVESLEQTILMLEHGIHYTFMNAQSAEWQANDGAVTTDEKISQNVTTMSGQQPMVSSNESTFQMDDVAMESWDNCGFMERPVVIGQGTWTVNDKLEFYIEPWKEFLKNPAVRSKIRNQWLLADATLVVRITFSGTAFHQGRAQLAYIPMGLSQPVSARYLLTEGVTDLRYSRLVYFSQQKDVLYADPSNNQPYDIRCPLVKFQPYLRFNGETDGTVIAELGEFLDFKGQGIYSVISFDELEAVTETPTNVTYNIYAWMEGVKMGVDTATKMVLAAQSEEITGPVQKVAMAAAEIASSLSSVPYIGAYAKAGEMIFNGMGRLAAINGFSRPNINTEPHRFKNEPFQNAANVIGSETGQKITLDPRCELSVSNTIDSEVQDEMHFRYIYERESYIDTIDWTTTSPIIQPIYSIGICPSILPSESIPLSDPLRYNDQPTPAGFLSTFFGNWRGTMVIKLDFIKTKFHAGALGMIYEPNAFQHNLILSSGIQLNIEKALIIDLNEVTSIELEINWNQGSLYLPTLFNRISAAETIIGASPTLNSVADALNGFLVFFPITTLQAPLAKSVHILVHARWKDLEFNAYTDDDVDAYSAMSWVAVGDLRVDEDNWISEEKSLHAQSAEVQTVHSMNKSSNIPQGLNIFEFGEKPCSWRTLLKRYECLLQASTTASGPSATTTLLLNVIPKPWIGVSDPKTGFTEYNPNTWGSFQRVRLAYLGLRGSHKYRVMQTPYILNGDMEPVMIGLLYVTEADFSEDINLVAALDTVPFVWGVNGMTMFLPKTQGGIEFQLPHYTNNLWAFSANTDPYDTAFVKHIDRKCYKQWYLTLPQHYTSTNRTANIFVYHSIGDDFTFMRFTGAPPFVRVPA